MSSLFAKLNLSHQERRLVVFVGLFLFLVLNLWLVWPHFGDLGLWKQRLRDMRAKVQQYQSEIQKEPTYKRDRDKLREAGQFLPEQDQARELLRQAQRQAASSGVRLVSSNPGRGGSTTTTNEFFDEETLLVTFESGPKELIEFLYNLGARGSLIRVRSMTLNPDPPTRSKLTGTITLVESFARTAPTRSPTGTAAAPRTAASSAPTPATTPTPITPANSPPPPPGPAATPDSMPMPALPEPAKTKTSPGATPLRPPSTNSGSGVVIPKRRPNLPGNTSS